MSKETPQARDRMGRWIDEQFKKVGAMPPKSYWTEAVKTDLEERRWRLLKDRNARLEETQECWETCNCKKKS